MRIKCIFFEIHRSGLQVSMTIPSNSSERIDMQIAECSGSDVVTTDAKKDKNKVKIKVPRLHMTNAPGQ